MEWFDDNGDTIHVGDTVRIWGGEYCYGIWEYDHTRVIVENDEELNVGAMEHMLIVKRA
jgi:hypothetical protein